MTFLSRTDTSMLAKWWWSVDRWLLGSLSILIAFGVFMVAAASPPVAERLNESSFYFLKKHLIFLVPSLALMFGFSFCSKKVIRRLGILGFFGAVGLLVVTLFMGVELNGAKRWLSIAGFSLQSSEFIKPTFALFAAWLFAGQHSDEQFPGYAISSVLCGVIVLLLLAQPDLGMTIVVVGVWAAQFFMAGLPLSIVAGLILVAVVGLFFVYLTFPHVTSRIDRFLDPSSGDTYQVDRSIEAFQNGGLLGTGPGQGEVKLILPDAHADFIFAISGEELGVIMTSFLVFLYLFIIIRGFKRLHYSDNLFEMLAVGGLLIQFGGQAFIHMGSSLSLLPAKGMTLPFVSYGGSSLIAMGIGMGIVLGLTRSSKERA